MPYFLARLKSETNTLPIFNLKMPKMLAGLDNSILDPRSSYDDVAEWEKRARHLGGLFIENFENSLIQKLARPRSPPGRNFTDHTRLT